MEFHSFGNKVKVNDGDYALIQASEKTPLRISHCRILIKGELHAISANSAQLEVQHSEVASDWQAIYWNALKGRAVIKNCLIVGSQAIVLTYDAAQEAELELTGNTTCVTGNGCCGYRFYQDPLDSEPKKDFRMVRCQATGNVFQSRSYFAVGELWGGDQPFRPEALANWYREHFDWEAHDNLFAIDGDFLAISNADGGKKPYAACKTLKDWQTYWKAKQPAGIESPPHFIGEDLLERIWQDRLKLTAADFRLKKGSPGQGAGLDGKDLGADVDRVGPGEPYEKWKQTPEYQEAAKRPTS